jgi:signal transduction histidine kinase
MRVAPNGNPGAIQVGLAGWSRHRITETRADVFEKSGNLLVPVASSDSTLSGSADENDREALLRDTMVVQFHDGRSPNWQVALPLGVPNPYGVLDVRVSTQRLQDWAESERLRAYLFALASALLVAAGVAVLTVRWVGKPLAELGHAMAGAHGGPQGSPPAPEIGSHEFQALAQQYNRLREALTARERESTARAALLTLEERARSLDRLTLMEETAAGLAHEIGTPLNTARGHLQLLRDDLLATQQHGTVDRVNLLLSQLDRVAQIVRLGLERGRWPQPFLREVDVRDTALHMLQFLAPAFEDAGVRALLSPSVSKPIRAMCDPALVEQILLNLLKNAVEALGPGGTISVTVSRETGTVQIEIRDDGPGLAVEAKAQLFNPFSTTKGPSGTGLGLAVSRRLARSLYGDLVHIPTERGTCWRLTLPAAPGN